MNTININATGIRPSVIDEIRAIAERLLVERVILFGSRARGDFKQTSDIDLAVFGGDAARFVLDIEEETSTLLKYDVVDLSKDVQPELLEEIKQDGRILYEKI